MRKRLRKDGFNVLVLSLDWHTMSDGVRGLYQLSEKLSSLALRIRKDRQLSRTRIYIVAHSAGGLVARYYVQLLGGAYYCDGLITLGTPHRGTWVAALGFMTHLILKAGCLYHMLPDLAVHQKDQRGGVARGLPHGVDQLARGLSLLSTSRAASEAAHRRARRDRDRGVEKFIAQRISDEQKVLPRVAKIFEARRRGRRAVGINYVHGRCLR